MKEDREILRKNKERGIANRSMETRRDAMEGGRVSERELNVSIDLFLFSLCNSVREHVHKYYVIVNYYPLRNLARDSLGR